jgi:predicted DNA-binding protein YlxM (UPF0122 family)
MDTTLSTRLGTNLPEVKDDALIVRDAQGAERQVKLSSAQLAAMEWLINDGSVKEAAEYAGVCRQTVREWINQDEDFQAAMEVWKRYVWKMNEAKLVGLSASAIQVVAAAIQEKGDVKAALAVLKSLGILGKGK